MKNIIFIAPPNGGKGTLSESLIEKYGYGHISTGDLLREEVKAGTELGKEADSLMKAGKFVPDEIILKLIEKRIQKPDCENGYILDGFPRTLVQAQKYDEMLNELGKDLGVVIYIDIDKDMALQRSISRITCPNCKRIFNKVSPEMKPKVEWICDDCGTELVQRSDDTEETFKDRFDTYINNVEPILNYYNDLNKLINVDASKNAEDIFKNIETYVTEVK